MSPDHDGYRGPVTLHAPGHDIVADADLRGALEPITGHYQWYGRLAATPAITTLATHHSRNITLTTPYATVTTTLSDPDPWNRYRISGTGHPPFPLPPTSGSTSPNAAC
jgi:uncharacterized protein DUF4873